MSGQVILIDEQRYSVSDETKEKLLKSRKEASEADRKTIRCPICGIRLIELYSSERPIVQVKCKKCKFEQPINTAYFRRGRRYKIKY